MKRDADELRFELMPLKRQKREQFTSKDVELEGLIFNEMKDEASIFKSGKGKLRQKMSVEAEDNDQMSTLSL